MYFIMKRVELSKEIDRMTWHLEDCRDNGTFTQNELDAMDRQLDQKRGELKAMWHEHGQLTDVMVAEEVSVMGWLDNHVQEAKAARAKVEALENQRDELREEIQKRDEWVNEHCSRPQRAQYDWDVKMQEKGHTR